MSSTNFGQNHPAFTLNANWTEPLCAGASDGSIDLIVIPGTGPTYSFQWTGPNGFSATTEDLTGLTAGLYVVTVDDNGTFPVENISISVQLTNPDPLFLSLTPYNVSFTGAADGSIVSNTSGGTGAYTYLWSDQQINADAFNLIAGNYSLTVTDANNCFITQTTTVNEPGVPLTIQLSSPVNSMGYHVTCGANNGTITSSTSGGNAPYTYLWYPNGQTTANLSGLDAGLHKVIVTDANGGIANAQITLTKQNPCYWGISGNSATNSFVNFLGTTDTAFLAFRTSNIENMRISKEGRVGIGTTLPEKALHVYTHHTNAGKEIERAPDHEYSIADKYQILQGPDDPVEIYRNPKFDPNGVAVSGTASGFGVVSGTGATQIPCCNDFSNGVSQGIRLEDFETVGNNTTVSKWDIEPLVTSSGAHLLGLSHIGTTSSSRILTLTDKNFVGVNVELPVTDFQVNKSRAVTLGQMSDGTNHTLPNGEYIGFNSYLAKSGSDMKLVKMTSPATAPQTGGAVIAADKEGNLHFQMYNAGVNSQNVTGYAPQITFTTAGGITTPAGPLGLGWLETPPTSVDCAPGMFTTDCIGIGTDNPQDKLDVHGNVRIVSITNPTSIVQISADGTGTFIDGFGSEDLHINRKSGRDVYIGGKPNDPSSLNVCGEITATKVTVQQSGCDFVFEKSHKRLPLELVKNFVDSCQHLPEIPASKETDALGWDLGKAQAQQLQKIEEIYLYLFEHQRDLAFLKEENAKLKKKIDEIKREK